MTTQEASCPAAAFGAGRAASPFNLVKSLAKDIASWVQRTADLWAAAALYDALHRLSDAELRRRGLSRAMLARDLFRSGDHIARG